MMDATPEEGDEGPWKTCMVKCRMCGERHVSVHPVNVVDEAMLECHSCHNMTCEPEEADPC